MELRVIVVEDETEARDGLLARDFAGNSSVSGALLVGFILPMAGVLGTTV